MRTSPLVRGAFLALLVLVAAPVTSLAAEPGIREVDPGTLFPPSSVVSDQKAGSILVYNFYKSDTSRPDSDTEINITNTHQSQTVAVHLFFVRNTSCHAPNIHVCLAGNQTVSFLASDFDPNNSGYIIAIAVDRNTGVPISHNFLIGGEYIKTASGHNGKLNAVAIAALYSGSLPGYVPSSPTATINFDGSLTGYNLIPRVLALDGIPSRTDGNDTLLVVNRIGGNLTGTVGPISSISGILYDDAENPHSFSASPNTCQVQSSLTNSFPSTVPPFESVIPTGRSGWMKFFEGSGDFGLLGAALNANNLSDSFTGARNLKATTLSESNSLVIPVITPPPACSYPQGTRANLVMNKTASPHPNVVRGTILTYTLTSTNNGPDAAFNVVIRDTLPVNTTFVSATPSAGGACTVPPVGGPGTVTCTFNGTTGLLVARSVTIAVHVNETTPVGTVISNTGQTWSVVTDPNWSNNSRTVQNIVIADPSNLVITTDSLPVGGVGVPYSATLMADNGTPPYTWSIVGGALPDGLSLSAGGVISGVPTTSGQFNFTARVTDAGFAIATRALTLTINPVIGLQYYPLPFPVRLLDTRPDPFTSCVPSSDPLTGGGVFTLPVIGNCGGATIPSSAKAVVGNATVVNSQSSGGFITLFPSNAAQPNASNLNFTANHIVPNSFTVGLGSDGAFKIFASASTNFIVDITGYYAPPGAGGLYFHPLPSPVRLLDTRPDPFTSCVPSSTPLTGGGTLTLPVAGNCNGSIIPTSAKSVVGNATVVNFQSGGGFVTLFPEGTAPNASNLNFTADHIVPNSFVVGLSASGSFNIFTSASTNFIVDIAGYFSDQEVDVNGQGLLFYPLSAPARWLDTRPDPFVSCIPASTPLAAGSIFTLQAQMSCEGQTVPAGAKSVLGNATVINFISGGGFITLFPSNAGQPNASNLNFTSNHIVPNSFVVGLGGDGKFKIFTSAATHFIVDLSGYFAP